jgi:hypothetical protein
MEEQSAEDTYFSSIFEVAAQNGVFGSLVAVRNLCSSFLQH